MSDITWLASEGDAMSPSILSQNYLLDFIDTLNLCNLRQYNSISNGFGRILDLVLSNIDVKVMECPDPLVTEDKYHKSICVQLVIPISSSLPVKPRKKFAYSRANYESISKDIAQIDWTDKLSHGDVDTATDTFYRLIYDLRNKHVPMRPSVKQCHPPWFNTALIKVLKEKYKHWRKYKTYGNNSDYHSFKILRDRAKKVEKDCYVSYIRGIESSIAKNPKMFWSYMKDKRGSSSFPSCMSYAGVVSDSGQGISELFSKFFHSTFNNVVDTSDNDIDNHLDIPSVCDIASIDIDIAEIERLLKSLDLSKAAGPDDLPASFITNCATELSLPIAIIFRRSLNEGVVPRKWKSAFISPIHKAGLKDRVGNYRPISKLCLVAKVFERIVYRQLYNQLKTSFSPAQHGFLRGRSTVSNLILFNNFITEQMDSGNQVVAVYTDYSKAFDRIDHKLLIKKLRNVGVRGNLLKWFVSYVQNRSQAVVLNGFSSSWMSIPSGVPQGSLLGPILFIIFINDIESCFLNSEYLLFADDMKVFRVVNDAPDAMLLQDDLHRLDDYCSANKLDLNVDKCFFINFTRKRHHFHISLSLKDKALNQVLHTKDLGVTHDSKLLFDIHINNIIGKACKAMGFLIRVSKPFRSMKTIKILYCAYVRSHLEYASEIWNPRYNMYIDRLERVQRRFTRFLGFKFKLPRLPYEQRCTKLHLLPLYVRRDISDVLFLAKILRGIIDSPEILSKIALRVPYHLTRKRPLLHVPSANCNYRQNSFLVRACNTYNRIFTESEIDLFCSSLSKIKNFFIDESVELK
ncbi:unnamed protein product [Plutella xylostella]|uniref:(diamondback moth) hypothetical protein n=1 Tax=Plutella xylostella TaxID=51655 RepID=A0A8S4G5U5_PLUXY|nr:unnamed protein product [Plutella xylostella]